MGKCQNCALSIDLIFLYFSSLAVTMYGPNTINTTIQSTLVSLSQETDYPFSDDIMFRITTSASVSFALLLRIPTWCDATKDMQLTVNNVEVPVVRDSRLTSFARIERVWKSGDMVNLTIIKKIRAVKALTVSNGWQESISEDVLLPSFNARVLRRQEERESGHLLGGGHMNVTAGLPFCTISFGPLLFALPLEQGGNYNYAIDCNASNMKVNEYSVRRPFDWPLEAPISITAHGQQFPWKDPWKLPSSPLQGSKASETITLIPYGCSKVQRVSMFPYIQ